MHCAFNVCVSVVIYKNVCFNEERACFDDCSIYEGDGNFSTCVNCKTYVECKGGKTFPHSCPHKPYWGYNDDTHKCQFKSPHCYPCEGN